MKIKFNTFWLGFGLFFLAFALFVPAYQGTFKTQLLCSILGLSALWGYWVQFKFTPIKISWNKSIVYVFLGLVLAFLPALMVDVPWRGDEDSNIDFVRIYAIITPLYQWIFGLIAYVVAGYFLLIKPLFQKFKWIYAVLGVAIFSYAIVHIEIAPYYNHFDYVFVVSRLTYLFRLLPLSFVVPVSWFGGLYEPAFYRIIPFLSYLAILYLIAKQWNIAFKGLGWVLLGIIALIPTLLIHHHVLYVELIGVFLLIYILGSFNEWISLPLVQLKSHPIWIALILLPFVKESFILIVAILLGVRYVNLIIQKKNLFAVLKWSEIKLAFILILPLVFYLYLRNKVNLRPAELSSLALKEWNTYANYFISIFEQFGALLFLYLFGLHQCLKRKSYLEVLFFSLAPLLIYLFFAADSAGIYKGYARFNLLLLPFLIYPCGVAIQKILSQSIKLRWVLVSALFGIQLFLYPLHLNGTKKAYWGDYFYDTSEHYYPFYEAFGKAKAEGVSQITYLSNNYQPYYYRFNFALSHLDYYPNLNIQTNMAVFNESDALGLIQNAFASGAEVVILQAHDFSMETRGKLSESYYQNMLKTLPYSKELLDNGEHSLLYIRK
jgi:hypothetical protein